MPENLQVIYDFAMNPASYDFLPFLGVAEAERRRRGCDGMSVHFMPGEHQRFYEAYFPKGDSEREGLFWRVCMAACRLVKSVRDVYAYGSRRGVAGDKLYPESWAPTRPDNTHGQQLFKTAIKCFDASAQAKAWVASKYRNYVTITLRECSYGAERNSDRPEWWKLGRAIQKMGGTVVVVPDTYGNTLKDFENCLPAAWDLDIRCALYQGALLNMGVANGPMSLAVLSNSKFAMLDTLGSDIPADGNIVKAKIPASELAPLVEPYLRAAA